MRMVLATSREMPAGLALVVGVMTSEEVRAADWESANEDVSNAALRALRSELEDDEGEVDW